MEPNRMFEIATRAKYRFPYKGQISVEDLWDLSLENLDAVFKSLNAQMKQSSEESLLQTRNREGEELAIKVNIIKHIVHVKMEEAEARRNAAANRERHQKIMDIIAEKKDAALRNMSVEDLEKLIKEG